MSKGNTHASRSISNAPDSNASFVAPNQRIIFVAARSALRRVVSRGRLMRPNHARIAKTGDAETSPAQSGSEPLGFAAALGGACFIEAVRFARRSCGVGAALSDASARRLVEGGTSREVLRGSRVGVPPSKPFFSPSTNAPNANPNSRLVARSAAPHGRRCSSRRARARSEGVRSESTKESFSVDSSTGVRRSNSSGSAASRRTGGGTASGAK